MAAEEGYLLQCGAKTLSRSGTTITFNKKILLSDSWLRNAYSIISRAIIAITGVTGKEEGEIVKINNLSNVTAHEADWIDFYNLMADVFNKYFESNNNETKNFKLMGLPDTKLALLQIPYTKSSSPAKQKSETEVNEDAISEYPSMVIAKRPDSNDAYPVVMVIRLPHQHGDFVIETNSSYIGDNIGTGAHEEQIVSKCTHFWKSILPIRQETRHVDSGTFERLQKEIISMTKQSFIPMNEHCQSDYISLYNECIATIQEVMPNDEDAKSLQKIEPKRTVVQPLKLAEQLSSPRSSSYFTQFLQKLQNVRDNYLLFTRRSWWNWHRATGASILGASALGAAYYWKYVRHK